MSARAARLRRSPIYYGLLRISRMLDVPHIGVVNLLGPDPDGIGALQKSQFRIAPSSSLAAVRNWHSHFKRGALHALCQPI